MTVGFSATNVLNPWLNAIRSGGSTFTVVAGTFVKLHTGDPGANGTANAAAGSTTRVAVTQGAAAGGAIAMTGTQPQWTNGGTSETISHVSVWDAITSGNFLYSVALTASQAWAAGNTFTLTGLGVTLTPVAA